MKHKRLPKHYYTVARDYLKVIQWNIKKCWLVKNRYGIRVWYTMPTVYYRLTADTAIVMAKSMARLDKVGYVFGITRGMKYTPKHRSNMILFDR